MKDDEEFIFVDNPSQQAQTKSVKEESVAPAAVSSPTDNTTEAPKNTENENNNGFTFLDPPIAQDSGPMTHENAIGAGAGLVASEVLRRMMPEAVPYNEDTKAKMETALELGKTKVAADVEAANATLPEDFKAHQERGLDLQTQRDMLKALHDQQEAAHEKALFENEYHKRGTVNDYLPPELRTDETPASGGENWAKGWENKERPGVGGVPQAAAAYQRSKGKGIISGRQTKLYGPSQVQEPGTPAVSLVDRLSAERLAAEQQQAIEEQRAAATPEAEQQLAEARAKAKIQMENAKKARDASHKQLMDIERALEAHRNTAAPTTPQISEETVRQQKLNDEIQRNLQRRHGANPLNEVMARFPGAESRVATPLASGAAAPYWAEKTQEAWEKNPNWREALTDPRVLTYGGATAGALAAMFPHAYVRGAGVLAQLPAVGLSGYDFANGPLPAEVTQAIQKRLTPKP